MNKLDAIDFYIGLWLFTKMKIKNKNILSVDEITFNAVGYNILRDVYGLVRIEKYIHRFDKHSEALNTFKNVCLVLQNLHIYGCLAIKFYCSQILSLDKHTPAMRNDEFIKITKKCTSFIFSKKINTLNTSEFYDFRIHKGMPITSSIKAVALYSKDVKECLNLTTKNDVVSSSDKSNNEGVIFSFINKLNQNKKRVLVEIEGGFYLKMVGIVESIYKHKPDQIKLFLGEFLKSDYCVNKRIESILFENKKQQAIAVSNDFANIIETYPPR